MHSLFIYIKSRDKLYIIINNIVCNINELKQENTSVFYYYAKSERPVSINT